MNPTFELASRPSSGPGTLGNTYIAKVNCFRVTVHKRLSYHRYDEIPDRGKNQEIKITRRRREIIMRMHTIVYPQVFQPGKVIYDGKASLFTEKDLGFSSRRFEVPMTDNPSTRPISVDLMHVGPVVSEDFQREEGDKALYMQQILNLLCYDSMDPASRQVTTKTTMFSNRGAKPIRASNDSLVVWFGCFANIRPSFDRKSALLNLDMASAVMYAATDLISLSLCLLGLHVGNPQALRDPNAFRRLQGLLHRQNIRVRQKKAGKIGRIRTVKSIVESAGSHRFTLSDGRETTIADYFYENYQYRLVHPGLPGIRIVKIDPQTQAQKEDIIPFELLEVVDGQLYRKKLEARVQAEVQSLSTQRPHKRLEGISAALNNFQLSALQSSGLSIGRTPEQVKGKILPEPTVIARSNVPVDVGTWRVPVLHEPSVVTGWALISYDRLFSSGEALGNLLNDLSKTMKNLGMRFDDAELRRNTVMKGYCNPQGKIDEDIRSIIEEAKHKRLTPDFFIIIVILPESSSTIYRLVKEAGDVTYGVKTQCMIGSKLRKKDGSPNRAVLGNIVLKINAKLGGKNFVAWSHPGMKWIREEKVMVIGADVSHPSPGLPRPSFAAIVSSVELDASRYIASCRMQAPRREIIENLEDMLFDTLDLFGARTNTLPNRIVFYRDGISEGEYIRVAVQEIAAINNAITRILKKAPVASLSRRPPLTYIVVGKRHHIRFFPVSKEQADNSGNCPPGLLVDTGELMNPKFYDFYLLSHAGLIGTSRPAHYVVLKDENGLDANTLQAMTYGLCHSFARASRSVSIPAPVYYADLVCSRADIHLRSNDEGAASTLDSDNYSNFNWQESFTFSNVIRNMRTSMFFT